MTATAAERLKELMSSEAGVARLLALMEPKPTPATPLETAVVVAADASATAANVKAEQLKSQLDLARRRVAELETILQGKENVIKNLEEQQGARGVELIARAVLLLEDPTDGPRWTKERDAFVADARASRAVAWEIDLRKAKR